MKRFEFEGYGGKKISVVEWADVACPRGVVQISHGMAEHALRYQKIAEYLNGLGYVVFADDHRAHGQTDISTLGYCDGDIFNDTLKDLAMLTDHYRQKYGLPVVLFGHSYGSFLSQRYLQLYGDKVQGVILGGSNRMGSGVSALGRFICSCACAFGKSKKPGNLVKKMSFDAYNKNFKEGTFISSIVSECERYDSDGLCGYICSYNFYKCFFTGLTQMYKKKNLKSLPAGKRVMLISGLSDPVGEMGKGVDRLEKLYLSYGLDVKKVTYPGVRHEYLNDTSSADAMAEIAAFCNELIG